MIKSIIYYHFFDEYSKQCIKIYVPENAKETYNIALRNMMETPGWLVVSREEFLRHWEIIGFSKISVVITGGTSQDNYVFSAEPTSQNVGEIGNVSWDTTDHEIATITSSGKLSPVSIGKTNVQCVVNTRCTNNEILNFYFFKQITVTEEMIKDCKK